MKNQMEILELKNKIIKITSLDEWLNNRRKSELENRALEIIPSEHRGEKKKKDLKMRFQGFVSEL